MSYDYGYGFGWPEIDLWPQVWDRDFGFAPIGARKIEPAMDWYYNDTPIDRERHNWLEPERQMLYEAIIAAAIARIIKIERLVMQLRGKDVWIWRAKSNLYASEGQSKMFSTEDSLIRNLARVSEHVIIHDWNRPAIVATDGTSNLHMLLGKFDIA